MLLNIDHLILFLIALMNAITAYLAWRTKVDMHKVEVATNSMKDALVEATAKASHAEGMSDQRAASGVPDVLEVTLKPAK